MEAVLSNADNLGGHTEQELYVEKVFADYKSEILAHIDIKTYERLIQQKVISLMNSYRVKNMKAYKEGWDGAIKKNDALSMNHLISLILYTDLSAYCSNFSSTFRKCTRYETLESIKARNAKYWWQSKFIREAVRCYGYDTQSKSGYGYNKETGPFYSGVDVVLCVEEFSMRLRGPTSTSKHIEVALNFSKRSGIILSLNNDGSKYSDRLPFINASWFSRYPDEVCVVSDQGNSVLL